MARPRRRPAARPSHLRGVRPRLAADHRPRRPLHRADERAAQVRRDEQRSPRARGTRTTVLRGDPVHTVGALRSRPGRELQIHGSARLGAALLAAGLVDTLRLVVAPTIIGSGTAAARPPERGRRPAARAPGDDVDRPPAARVRDDRRRAGRRLPGRARSGPSTDVVRVEAAAVDELDHMRGSAGEARRAGEGPPAVDPTTPNAPISGRVRPHCGVETSCPIAPTAADGATEAAAAVEIPSLTAARRGRPAPRRTARGIGHGQDGGTGGASGPRGSGSPPSLDDM